MSQFKKRSLDERLTIVLFSNKFQIHNAFATTIPFHFIGLFPSGAVGRSLSVPFWFDSIFEHELNHVFQLSHSKVPKIVRKLFNIPSIFLFYTIVPYPNALLPRFILEGDAVLKESLIQKGGRLYNGDARALVFSQIKHYRHKISSFVRQNLLNVQTAHSGREKYLHGGYFMAMLAETYSHNDIHAFFTPGKNIPKRKKITEIKNLNVEDKLSSIFKNNFSFQQTLFFIDDLTTAYFNHYMSQASLQKSSPKPSLMESMVCPPLSRFGDDIVFLTSDYKSQPVLNTFNTKTKKWTHQKKDLPLGKVFKINKKYYSKSSLETSPNTTQYSLFSEGHHHVARFDSKYMEDIHQDQLLYTDITDTLEGYKLYLNEKFYSYTHSNALFDSKGSIYYFQQKENKRTLYKNKKPLFSYTGFYGEIMDIDPQGTVYFTGSSPYGSSVYQYKKGSVFRVSSSDTVIQAKKIGNQELLVCEVTPFGYEYKKIPMEIRQQTPVMYKYRFKTRHHAKLKPLKPFSKSKKTTTHKNSVKRKLAEKTQKKPHSYKKYSSLRHINYRGGQFIAMSVGYLSQLSSTFLFTDYLLNHNFQLIYMPLILHPAIFKPLLGSGSSSSWFDLVFQIGQFRYTNLTHRLNWGLGYQMFHMPIETGTMKNGIIQDLYVKHLLTHTGYLQLKYPLFKKGRWFSNLSSFNTATTDTDITYSIWRGSWNLGYTQKFHHRYAPSKAFHFNMFLSGKQFYDKDIEDSQGLKTGAVMDATWHLGSNFYILPALSYTKSFNQKIHPAKAILFKETIPKNLDLSVTHSDLAFDDTDSSPIVTNNIVDFIYKKRFRAESIGSASLGFKKAFYLGSHWLNLHYLTPVSQVRWMIFKNLLSSGGLLEEPVEPSSGKTDSDLYTEQAQLYLNQLQRLSKSQPSPSSTYTQWLEWTFGVESGFLVQERLLLILGFSYGFRTPVQFWKSSTKESPHDDNEDISEIETGTGGTSVPTSLTQFLPSSSAGFYLKVPL